MIYRTCLAGLSLFCAAGASGADTLLTDLPATTASANSCYLAPCDQPGSFSARNAIDHQSYSYASGTGGWSAGDHGTPSDPNWLRLDFGGLYQLSSVHLEFNDTQGHYAGFTNVYELYTSTDGTN